MPNPYLTKTSPFKQPWRRSRVHCPPGPWGVAGLPPRAIPSHRFRLPGTMSSSSWGGSPSSLRRFQPPPVRPTTTTSTMQRSSPRQQAFQLARPQRPLQPAALAQRSRPTLQVETVVTPTKHQEAPRSFVGPRAPGSSDSDEPLVPRRRDAPKVVQYSRGSASRADEVHRDTLAVRRLARGKIVKSSIGAALTRAEWWPSRAKVRGITPFPHHAKQS